MLEAMTMKTMSIVFKLDNKSMIKTSLQINSIGWIPAYL